MRKELVLALSLLPLAGGPAAAQIVVSANDGKQESNPSSRRDDTIVLLDLSANPVHALATLRVPTSMIGPPASVAVAPDGRFALVTSSLRVSADGELLSNDVVSVVDLTVPTAPRIVQSLRAGANASGVAISLRASLALVANRSGDSVSVFSIKDGRLADAGHVALETGSAPVDVAFSADGSSAYVVENGTGRLIHLAVEGETLVLSGRHAQLGEQPYSLTMNDREGLAYVTNLGGERGAPNDAPQSGSLSIVDLGSMLELERIIVGRTPEHVSISPDGEFVQVNLINGSNSDPGSSDYADHGYLSVFAVKGRALEQVARLQTGKWCQGAAWNRDRSKIYLQCADQRTIEVYLFDGTSLKREDAEIIVMAGRPGALATAADR